MLGTMWACTLSYSAVKLFSNLEVFPTYMYVITVYLNVTDRQTDRRCGITTLCVASRGNKTNSWYDWITKAHSYSGQSQREILYTRSAANSAVRSRENCNNLCRQRLEQAVLSPGCVHVVCDSIVLVVIYLSSSDNTLQAGMHKIHSRSATNAGTASGDNRRYMMKQRIAAGLHCDNLDSIDMQHRRTSL